METVKVELNLREVEEIKHNYLMSWSAWNRIAYAESAKGLEHDSKVSLEIAEYKEMQYKKFKEIAKEMEKEAGN